MRYREIDTKVISDQRYGEVATRVSKTVANNEETEIASRAGRLAWQLKTVGKKGRGASSMTEYSVRKRKKAP